VSRPISRHEVRDTARFNGKRFFEGFLQLSYHSFYKFHKKNLATYLAILEMHWNGAKLIDTETRLAWAKSMTWKRLHSIVWLSSTIAEKAISLNKKAMRVVESRLRRYG
jgi:hypothetical protein